MTLLSSLRSYLELDVTPDLDGATATRRSNRRRLRVFLLVFLLVLVPGLVWNFMRPAEYMASARVQINPGRVAAPASGGEAARSEAELLTQAQKLTSRPLLEKVAGKLAGQGLELSGGDAAVQLQRMIRVVPIAGTEVVEVQAVGARPQQLATALNVLLEAYRDEMKATFGSESGESLDKARSEVERLTKAVQERRARLDAFRSENGVLSPERDENEAVAQVKGLATALNAANEKAAQAEARLLALRETVANGRGASAAKDDPTLAAMENRAAMTREELREMDRVYTPEYMNLDPRARALKTRLIELERQIDVQRVASQQAAVAAAEQERASARATVERLQAQINAQKAGIQSFSSRFTQVKSQEDDLAQIEKASRDAMERYALLEASDRSRQPGLKLLESASVPRRPFRPDYLADAAIVLGLAFGLGLLAMWFVELFHRQPPAKAPAATTTVIVPPQWGLPQQGQGGGVLPGAEPPVLSASAPAALGVLPAQAPIPRELSQSEASALLAAAGEARFMVALLLMGLTADEVTALRQQDLDAAAGALHIGGHARRTLAVPGAVLASAPAASADPAAPLLKDASGAALSTADIESMVACAALDAGLSAAATVTADALRHTCIAWLVRQGLRFSDLAGMVGRPSAEALAFYAELAPDGPKRGAAEVEWPMPALRETGV
ncbi:MAG: hypothetical protein KAX47_04010 [Zoogloea sp.]|nr:hypothetical protein [Zoogloea sp.]